MWQGAHLEHLLRSEAQQRQVQVKVDDWALGVRSRGKHDLEGFYVENLQRPMSTVSSEHCSQRWLKCTTSQKASQ